PGPLHANASAAQHHAADSVPAAVCPALAIWAPLGPAQAFSVGFHHRAQRRLARLHAQTEKRLLNVAKHPVQRDRQLHLNLVGTTTRNNLLRAKLHLGDSFLCLAAPAYHMQAERSYRLPLQLQFNRFRDIAPNPAGNTYWRSAVLLKGSDPRQNKALPGRNSAIRST